VRIYVGNLNYQTTEDSLKQAFGEYGQVEEVAIIMDRETNRPRGFAFVTMAEPAGGNAAIEALNGQEFEGRTLTVNEARPRGGGSR
jgi:RNA recognition motif-containing protein